jgi:hypothetical protein
MRFVHHHRGVIGSRPSNCVPNPAGSSSAMATPPQKPDAGKPQLDMKAAEKMNLTVLKRLDPGVEEVRTRPSGRRVACLPNRACRTHQAHASPSPRCSSWPPRGTSRCTTSISPPSAGPARTWRARCLWSSAPRSRASRWSSSTRRAQASLCHGRGGSGGRAARPAPCHPPPTHPFPAHTPTPLPRPYSCRQLC